MKTTGSNGLDRARDSMAEIERLLGGSQQQHVTISGNAAGLAVSLVGVLAISVAVCAVIVVAVMRSQDVRDMSQIRARLMQLEQYRERDAKRLDECEIKRSDTK